jgi:Kef-type K+ transport system membrane component KefB
MPDVSFTNLLVVASVAVLAPMTVGFAPRLRIPAVVLEIIGGIIIGPSGFGWVRVDLPVQILALFGLAFLLFLAGLEIDVHQLRGRLLRFAVLGYVATLVLGYGAGASFAAVGWVSEPLLLAITLSATSLGSHPNFRTKLDAIGYGFLIPVFFVSSGIRLNLTGLLHSPSALARVPLFLLALLAVRGLPALFGLRANGTRPTMAVGLLQATSLPFIVTATQIGVALGKLSSVTAAALVCAGLLSVLIFPLLALGLLRRDEPGPAALPDVMVSVAEPHAAAVAGVRITNPSGG